MKKKVKQVPKKMADITEEESLEQLLKRLGIVKWDCIIVGDGSGSNWSKGAGWSSVVIEREGERDINERSVWYGAVNRGTVNLGEIMAYLQPLEWLVSREVTRRSDIGEVDAYHVHIITDSDYCRLVGNSNGGRILKKNAGLWSVFNAFAHLGFIIKWHWIPRASCELNRYCDELSKVARLNLKNTDLRKKTKEKRSVYELNATED